MSTFEHVYYKRAKCNMCSDITWTTDALSSVRCACNEVVVTPMSIMGGMYTEPTDAEHIAKIIEGYNLPVDTVVNLIKA